MVEYLSVESEDVKEDASGIESKSYVNVVDPVEVILKVPLNLLSLTINWLFKSTSLSTTICLFSNLFSFVSIAFNL